MMRTQIGIVGAGPAGLLLSERLRMFGIDSVVLERRDRAYVEGRIRAGVLEQGTVDLLNDCGCGERMAREGLVHGGIEISLDGRRRRIDFPALTGGKTVHIYGQTEVVKDLIKSRRAAGGPILFEARDVTPGDIQSEKPCLRFVHEGATKTLRCDFIAGCDGFHGVCRHSFPESVQKTYECLYPFAWLGILAEAPPISKELIYARHERGFALCSMRSPTISRNYIQCAPDEDLADWPDDRIWEEISLRLGPDGKELVHDGPVRDKSVTPMRSFVSEPLRSGRLFLAGDAAHIVPPTGAKGLNLAASDVYYLSEAFREYYKSGRQDLLDGYSGKALDRVWKAQRFSWWMTSMLHRFPDDQDFQNRLHRAELDYVLSSTAAMTSLAENYVGLPY
jgi:p-hydroxybenzoate 3-monooxygenase